MKINPIVAFAFNLNTVRRRTSAGKRFLWQASLVVILSCVPVESALAQNAQFTQGNDSTGLDHSMTIPLRVYPGRGTASLPITLFYSSKVWRIDYKTTVYADPEGSPPGTPQVKRALTEAIYAENSRAGWTTSLDVPTVEWPKETDRYWWSGKPYHSWVSNSVWRVSRVFIHTPDGSTHELRESDQPYLDQGTIDMTGTFYAVDGSRMRYTTPDSSAPLLPDGSTASGVLYMPDGSRYVLGATYSLFIDRNGNTLTYNGSSRQWTDALNRQLNIPLPNSPQAQDYTYTLPGIGSNLTYTLKWKNLSNALTPVQGQTPTLLNVSSHYLPSPCSSPTNQGGGNFPTSAQGGSLFSSSYSDPDPPETPPSTDYTYVVSPCNQSNGPFNPVVLSEIVLPNGQFYKFTYNIHGEMDKVVYLTGAFEQYEFSNVTSPNSAPSQPYSTASRGVTKRKLSADGTGGDLVEWSNNAATHYSPITFTSPDGTQKQVFRHKYAGETLGRFGYDDSRNGMIYEVRNYGQGSAPIDLNNPKGAMLRRILTNWITTTSAVPPRISPITGQPYIGNNVQITAYRNSRSDKGVSIILDTGGSALSRMTEFEYQSNGNELNTGLDMTKSTTHHFASVSQTTAQSGDISNSEFYSGPIARSTVITYSSDSGFRNRHILGLATSSIVSDANDNEVSKAETFYDETSPLTYTSVPGWTNPNTTYRANITSTRRYSNIGANLYLETHGQYDQCGNMRTVTNERGIQSQVDYDTTYRAYPIQTTTAVPDPSGSHGSNTAFTSTSSYDTTTGLVLSTTDANGQTTTLSYVDDQNNPDVLNRLRKVTQPNGGWTKITYHDTVGTPGITSGLYVYTETQMDAGRTNVGYQFLDAMGREVRSQSNAGGSNYLTVDTQYDEYGRAYRTSAPYTTSLAGSVNPSGNWITNTSYDGLNRVTLVTYPDNTTLGTSYSGIYTTSTDQAGRQRRDKSDAFGRIVRVDEADPDSSGSLGSVDSPNLASYYDYDTLGNLIHVQQGKSAPFQHRYFKYDALSRITYERQVEAIGYFTQYDSLTGNSSWSRKMVYDETINNVDYKGLLTTTCDARNVCAQYKYDQLDRNTQVSYSDRTPTVTSNYDQTHSGYFNKGKLTELITASVTDDTNTSYDDSVPETRLNFDFDLMGRSVKSSQTVGSNVYNLAYKYNLGGQLTQQTYPSGRVVNYGYDDASRLSNLNSGQGHVYAEAFTYAGHGPIASFTMGNGATVNLSYGTNGRLQLTDLTLAKNGNVLQRYKYTYGLFEGGTLNTNKNNGQIAQVESWIGTEQQYRQQYYYDSLGRLTESLEKFGASLASTAYDVKYRYDVFGNRQQRQSDNSGNTAITQKWVESGDISTLTNRFTTGVTYDNAGNVIADQRFHNLIYGYDANGRQNYAAAANGSGPVTAIFDGAGQRVANKAGGVLTIMVYDTGGKLVAEYGAGAPTTANLQYVTSDYQSSTRVVTNGSGAIVNRRDYLPFGEELGANVGPRTTGQGFGLGDNVRQKHAGMETDEATGMAHTLWRKQDNLSGRWTSPDPYGGSLAIANPQSFNRYAHVNNDPTNLTDPLGLMAGADQPWDGNWGGELGLNNPHFGGPGVIAEAAALRDKLVQGRLDGILAQKYFDEGNVTAGMAVLARNSDVGLHLKGQAKWGMDAVKEVPGMIQNAIVTVTAILNSPLAPGGQRSALEFGKLWAGHPGWDPIRDDNGNPIDEHMCAMKLFTALVKAGFDVSSYNGYKMKKLAARAYELGDWLVKALGHPTIIIYGGSQESVKTFNYNVSPYQGIILLKRFWGDGLALGHIDVIRGCDMKGGSSDYITRTLANPRGEVWFWRLP